MKEPTLLESKSEMTFADLHNQAYDQQQMPAHPNQKQAYAKTLLPLQQYQTYTTVGEEPETEVSHAQLEL